eukprot:s3317_g1.t1
MDLISTDGQCVVRAKAISALEKSGDLRSLELALCPAKFLDTAERAGKQTLIPLNASLPEAIDEEAEAVTNTLLAKEKWKDLVLHCTWRWTDRTFSLRSKLFPPTWPSAKAHSALKHLASYLDGTAEDGLFLQNIEESQSWADCKATRKSTNSGLVFLNGAMILTICRAQASVALSSCEAELYAANGLMVESMYLYRLCRFLCKGESEVERRDVQKCLYTSSSSAMALMQRRRTGRLKHVPIKQFFLQDVLRAGVFTIHKVNAKLNAGDLNTRG